ncbi:unnamed protein product [Paramecium pentaurelia]|uniref:Uncharacterized protein n=1 Tax=Paramecium pentaurelia TaxID=43138 RepID=A0A8S1V4H7_9CILI|nr:unnamed protein product [Paramecium pentaurelia]
MSTADVIQDSIQDECVLNINWQINNLYQQIQQEVPYKLDKQICAFTFNKSNQLLVGACLKNIQGYVINKGQLKLISTMIGHIDNVRITRFMNVTSKNILISASEDRSLRVWSYTQLARPKFLQKINAHMNGILCFILNKSEDLLITGSRDTTLKFWKKNNQVQNGCILATCVQTLNQHSHNIYDLSLSPNEDKLISCAEDSRILIISLIQSEWKVTQIIQVQKFGFRLSFIDNNIFTFQPILAEFMQVYELNQDGQFIKTFDVQVKGGIQDCRIFFPQQYISEKNLLINKNGFHINIIKVIFRKEKKSQKLQKAKFVVEQSISFGQESTGLIFGQLSDNAEYLITWDGNTKELQMRQLIKKIN